MTYKNLFIITLLTPFALASNVNTEQLKNDTSKKELELAAIIEAINEKENIIDSLVAKAKLLLPFITHELNSQDLEELRSELNELQFNTLKSFDDKGFVEYSFNKNFIEKHKKSECELERAKYLAIRYSMEYINLKKLIKQYQQKLQELIDLNYKLERLKN